MQFIVFPRDGWFWIAYPSAAPHRGALSDRCRVPIRCCTGRSSAGSDWSFERRRREGQVIGGQVQIREYSRKIRANNNGFDNESVSDQRCRRHAGYSGTRAPAVSIRRQKKPAGVGRRASSCLSKYEQNGRAQRLSGCIPLRPRCHQSRSIFLLPDNNGTKEPRRCRGSSSVPIEAYWRATRVTSPYEAVPFRST